MKVGTVKVLMILVEPVFIAWSAALNDPTIAETASHICLDIFTSNNKCFLYQWLIYCRESTHLFGVYNFSYRIYNAELFGITWNASFTK